MSSAPAPSSYEVPNWAGKPPTGLHLDVLKDGKLIQKLMIDEKKCYLFGRNSQMNDFCIDHQSCSRVHAAFVYHKHLTRAFLVDLGSTHGTFIGNVRLEANKPTQLPVDSSFHFGASTRNYVIRERPQAGPRGLMDELEASSGQATDSSGALLGLPETETELDNLTEFNTAHNRRITMLGISDDKDKGGPQGKKGKRRIRITFNEDEEVINPEDVDPSVGRFRNMVETTVIPRKRPNSGVPGLLGTAPTPSPTSGASPAKRSFPGGSRSPPPPHRAGLYEGLSGPSPSHAASLYSSAALASKLGMALPNPAPEIDLAPAPEPVVPAAPAPTMPHPEAMMGADTGIYDPDEPKKKKYAKEAWPGKKPTPSLLV